MSQHEPDQEALGLIRVEHEQRLSASLLWSLQRAYYLRQGISAWSTGTVPHYITNNPFIAAAYAKVVIGYLRDWLAVPGAIDRQQPIYIVELGAGTGRFAYHFVAALQAMQARLGLLDLRCVYVLTDLGVPSTAFWLAHPAWQPWLAQGLLDVAQFDITQDQALHLMHSGERIVAHTATQPMIVLANYLLDSIPQDIFTLAAGQLSETLVTLDAAGPLAADDDPALLEHLALSYSERPITLPYYDDPDLDQILASYQREFSETTFTLPCAAIRLLRTLRELAGGGLLVLGGDKGYTRADALEHGQRPAIATHGSFSMMVNYHALGEYARASGGAMLQTAHRAENLNVIALLLGTHPSAYAETRQAFAEAIEQHGPDDFYSLKKALEPHYAELSVPQLLAHLRVSRWDANILLGCFTELLQRLPSLPAALRPELLAAIEQVWMTYYHIGEERNLAFSLGVLVSNLGYWREALPYFAQSLALYGPHAGTTLKLALCHERLGEFELARAWLAQTLELDPALPPARAAAQRLGLSR